MMKNSPFEFYPVRVAHAPYNGSRTVAIQLLCLTAQEMYPAFLETLLQKTNKTGSGVRPAAISTVGGKITLAS
jgi:hypothetical protein